MILLKDVVKQYQNNLILNHINMELLPGNIYLLKGNSGSGKSTLLNILGGLDETYDGSVLVEGCDLKQWSKSQQQAYRLRIGYVFQESLLLSDLNIMENLRIIIDDEAEIMQLAQQFQVQHLLSKKPTTLSNGERQRIAIIRSILRNPDIILLDEPSAALDQKNAYQLADIISQLRNSKRIVLIVSHDTCFDHIADVRFHISYGNIMTEYRTTSENDKPSEQRIKYTSNKHHMDKELSYRRFKRSQKSPWFMLSCSLLILVLMLSLSLTSNFASSYRNKLYSEYPVWTFRMSEERFEKRIQNKEDFEVHTFYKKDYDDFQALPYFAKENSSLHIPNALLYGEYPTSDNDVIISYAYQQSLWPKDKEQSIGKSIFVDDQAFRVTGILTQDKDILRTIINPNINYWEMPEPVVFFSETVMKSLGAEAKTETKEIMVDYIGSDKTEIMMQTLLGEGFLSYYDTMLKELVFNMNFILKFVYLAIVIIAFLIFIFMYYVIHLDIANRKRELGYLQLFGFSKYRIKKMVIFDYVLKVIPSWIMAIFLYAIIMIYINNSVLSMPYGIIEVGIASLLLLGYMIVLIILPLRTYLNKCIKDLIQ